MQAPPGATGPQLSPDGNYWWDGSRWTPLAQPVPGYLQPAPYRLPDPSPGLRVFLLVVLVIANVITTALGLLATLALADYAGIGGAYEGPPIDVFDYALIGYFWLAAGVTDASTVAVVVRGGRIARVAAIIAGVVLSASCVGLVLGIPIIVAAIRAPMTKRSS